jgi:hypothetical protein
MVLRFRFGAVPEVPFFGQGEPLVRQIPADTSSET